MSFFDCSTWLIADGDTEYSLLNNESDLTTLNTSMKK